MSGNFHEAYLDKQIAPPSEQATGLVFAAIFGLLAAVNYNKPYVWLACIGLAIALALISWLAAWILRPISLLWFRLSMLLHRVVTPIVMCAIYFLIFVPFGLTMRFFRDPLRRRRQDCRTYWVDRVLDSDTTSMRDQF